MDSDITERDLIKKSALDLYEALHDIVKDYRGEETESYISAKMTILSQMKFIEALKNDDISGYVFKDNNLYHIFEKEDYIYPSAISGNFVAVSKHIYDYKEYKAYIRRLYKHDGCAYCDIASLYKENGMGKYLRIGHIESEIIKSKTTDDFLHGVWCEYTAYLNYWKEQFLYDFINFTLDKLDGIKFKIDIR